jgi:DNA-binding transcriptional LysR family regulator
MSEFELRNVNLNLLPALEALLETRNVSAAARRSHVSQSAMSHSLAKLRDLLGDPLLVPSGRAFVLTPRAARILAELPSALDVVQRAIEPPRPFSARDTKRSFRVATFDYFEFVMLGDLLAYFSNHAPQAHLSIERFSPSNITELLAGEIDVALVGETSIARTQGLSRAELFRDPFTVMLRKDHPALVSRGKRKNRALSLDAYLAYPHVVVTLEGRQDGAVDRALERSGVRRTVSLRVPHFTTAPLAVLQSDAICTIATSVAMRARELYGLELRAPPIDLPAPLLVAVWSKRVDDDEGGRWFRDLFSSGTVGSKSLRHLMVHRGGGGLRPRPCW